jgi:hypothetical protein
MDKKVVIIFKSTKSFCCKQYNQANFYPNFHIKPCPKGDFEVSLKKLKENPASIQIN